MSKGKRDKLNWTEWAVLLKYFFWLIVGFGIKFVEFYCGYILTASAYYGLSLIRRKFSIHFWQKLPTKYHFEKKNLANARSIRRCN